MKYGANDTQKERTTRNGFVNPKNQMQIREQLTIAIAIAIKSQGYEEKAYEKPFRNFVKEGSPQIKLNPRDGSVSYGKLEFKGHRFGYSLRFFNELKSLPAQ